MWYIYKLEYYLAIKINKVLIHATTWMNLKNIMLKLKKPVKKDHILYDSYDSIHMKVQKRKIHRDKR